VVSFTFLALFSVMEMTLSIVREQIIEQDRETDRLAAQIIGPVLIAPQPSAEAPAAAAPTEAPQRANVFGLELSTFAQLILAGVIPWLLAAAALPLETIIRNSVFIISIFASFALIFLSFICKTISALFKNIGVFLLAIYDFIIFLPLFAQRWWKQRQATGESGPQRRGQAEDELVLNNPPPPRPSKREKSRQPEPEFEKAS
jgi:hypothetical protein